MPILGIELTDKRLGLMLNAKSANDASSQSAFKARWMKSMTRKNLGEALGCQKRC